MSYPIPGLGSTPTDGAARGSEEDPSFKIVPPKQKKMWKALANEQGAQINKLNLKVRIQAKRLKRLEHRL